MACVLKFEAKGVISNGEALFLMEPGRMEGIVRDMFARVMPLLFSFRPFSPLF